MELLWQNGQVVAQNQRLHNNNTKKPSSSSSSPTKLLQPPIPPSMDNHHQQQQPSTDQNLFIQEDEMTSWLHYPLRDDDFCSDLLFSAAPTPPCATSHVVTAVRPPVPVPSSSNESRPPVRNFMNFSRLRGDFSNGRGESGPKTIVRESTQVSPSATPSSAAASESGLTRRTDGTDSSAELNRKGKAVAMTAPAIEITGTSSSAVSKSEIEPEKTNVDDKKRKEREATTEEAECRSEVSQK